MKRLSFLLLLTLVLTLPQASDATRIRRGYVYPQVETKNNCFYIYYQYSSSVRCEYVTQVNVNGRIKKLQQDVLEAPEYQLKRSDRSLAEKFHLAYARIEAEQGAKVFFQGMTSECRLQLFMMDKTTQQIVITQDLGDTSLSEKPIASEMVLYDNKIYIAYWSQIGWAIYDDYQVYNLVICEWDFLKNTTHVYPIAHIERNDYTTLSMAVIDGTLGLAYFECDDSDPSNKYNRIRFVLIDSKNLTVMKSIWASR